MDSGSRVKHKISCSKLWYVMMMMDLFSQFLNEPASYEKPLDLQQVFSGDSHLGLLLVLLLEVKLTYENYVTLCIKHNDNLWLGAKPIMTFTRKLEHQRPS